MKELKAFVQCIMKELKAFVQYTLGINTFSFYNIQGWKNIMAFTKE
jgi:hypothetical protein